MEFTSTDSSLHTENCADTAVVGENIDTASDAEVAAANSKTNGIATIAKPNAASILLINSTPEVESTTDEEIAKLKAEKTFRKQEEEWLRKREKVSYHWSSSQTLYADKYTVNLKHTSVKDGQ